MNKELELGIKYREDFVNKALAGKTIKRLFGAESTRVFVEFTDGSQGMIEVLNEEGGEKYLSVMPPTPFSEEYRKIILENRGISSARRVISGGAVSVQGRKFPL